MSKFQNKSNQLNSYLQHLAAHEKTKRKWQSRIFMGAGALAFLVALFTLSFFSLQSKVETDNTDLPSPDDIFVELPVRIDSLDNDLFSLSSEPEEVDFDKESLGGELAISDLDLGLFVEGSKAAGEKLNLVILGFDEGFTYEVDLGIGSREKISEPVFPFTYRKTGTYELSLIVSDQNESKRTFKRSISITSKETTSARLKKDREALLKKEVEPSPSITAIDSEESSIEGDELLGAIPSLSIPTPVEESQVESPLIAESNGDPTSSPSTTGSSSKPKETGNTQFNFKIKEKMPEFPGGKKRLKKYLSKNITYPDEAIQNQIEGNVIVRFAVEPDGSISNPTIVKGLGYGCDEEALRLVTHMPFWSPGMQGERAVRAYSAVSIMFNMW